MAEQFYTILTAVGKAKIANAAALGKKVELTELALGDGGGSYYNPTEDQTELRNEVWRGAIGAVDVDGENPNWIIIQTVVPSQHGGFMIREAGVFDNEGDLIAVGKYPETYKPVAADGSIKDLVVRMILEVSNTASVVLKVDPTVVLATQQRVDEAEARAKAYTDQQVAEVNQALDAHLADGASHSKTARFVVGTSTAGWTLEDCDYLCDGTNDQEEIIQALNALPATGGEVVILDGTYNITASINIPKDNVSLRGNGNATILKRMYNSTNTDSGPTASGLITLNEKSGCKIQCLQINGNKATYTASYNYGIYLSSSSDNTVTGNTCNNNSSYGISLYSSSSDNTVTGNTCNNNYSGIRLSSSSNNTVTSNICNNNNDGISLSSSSNNTVTGNTCNNSNNSIYLLLSSDNTVTCNICNNNSNNGIRLDSSSNNTVTSNICNNNNASGIYLYSSSNNNTVTGNTCNNNSSNGIYLYSSNNTVTCNICNNNSNNGIRLDTSSNNTVTGNTCNNNNSGIRLASSSNNTVTGNTCIRGTGVSEDYTTDQYTIRLSSTGNNYNLISSNNCMGKDVVIEGGTGNTSVNNKYN